MKIKFFATLFVLAMGSVSVFAQKGVEDGSKYGHGQDSINCLNNLSVYYEYVKTGNFRDAYLPWKAVIEECPKAQLRTYTSGVQIMKWKLQNEKDPAKYNEYFNELMNVYDLRMKYFGTYKSNPADAVLALKALDYYLLCKDNKDPKLVYSWFKQSVESRKDKSEYYALEYWIATAADVFKNDQSFREQFIDDYMTATEYVDAAIANCKDQGDLERLNTSKNNINAYFVNSGAADCANLQSIYGAQIESNKTNIEYLRTVIRIMELLGCTEEDAYFKASLYAHDIEPTAESALGCAAMFVMKKDYNTAVKYYDEALALEQDNLKKAEIAYKAGAVLYTDSKYSQARTYARKAIEFNSAYGDPYLLIAKADAAAPNWSDDPAMNACTYCLAVDKLLQAKNVDPSCAEEANRLINTYSAHYPSKTELFMQGYNAGDRITIGGWIGESTTIRCK